MTEQTADEEVDRPVIVVHVAMANIDEDLGMDEVYVIAEASVAKALVEFVLGGH
jgi:hypothetical protein